MKLKELTREHCEKIRQWRNEGLISLRTPYPLTEKMQSSFYDDVISNRDSAHRYLGLHLPAASGTELIGMGGMTYIQWENSIAEISLIIKPGMQGKGYGLVAVEKLLNHAFNNMGLKTVFGECYLCNDAHNFWRKITAKYKGYETTLPNRKFWDGEYHDSLYFSIDKDNFNNED